MTSTRTILVTGGAGFIGSALIRHIISETPHNVVNVDKLSYAGNLESLTSVSKHPRYHFEQADICDGAALQKIFSQYQPDLVMHLAAETHVDRSIDTPENFIYSNIMGTYRLLEEARAYWQTLPSHKQQHFRLHHISTDEVYGDIASDALPCSEEAAYAPSSPYAASKASADHLVRAWQRTFGLPVVLSNCANNYGAYQFPEKFIPVMILNALADKALPIYGDGQQIRDWLFVDDHVRALLLVATRGSVGESYNIGAHNERRNLEVVHTLCAILQELVPKTESYHDLITFVTDRPGHDRRYAIDASKIRLELGWQPLESFETGLRKTVQWYVDNLEWCERVQQPFCGRPAEKTITLVY